jgi:hypothetical protein
MDRAIYKIVCSAAYEITICASPANVADKSWSRVYPQVPRYCHQGARNLAYVCEVYGALVLCEFFAVIYLKLAISSRDITATMHWPLFSAVILFGKALAYAWNEQLTVIDNGVFTGRNGYPRCYVSDQVLSMT